MFFLSPLPIPVGPSGRLKVKQVCCSPNHSLPHVGGRVVVGVGRRISPGHGDNDDRCVAHSPCDPLLTGRPNLRIVPRQIHSILYRGVRGRIVTRISAGTWDNAAIVPPQLSSRAAIYIRGARGWSAGAG